MSRDPEQELIEEIAACWDDPLRYVMMAFPWGEPDGPLEGFDGPDDWQRELLASVGEWVRSGAETALRDATSSGHGIGKSALTAWIILWFASTRPHCAGVATANTQSQLKSKTWRELSVWHQRALNAHWFRWTATRFQAVDSPETWGIDAIPWSEHNPEAFAGLHADDVLVIYDEASAVADPIWEVTEGAMTTPGAMWFAFGNPTRNTGRFREVFGSRSHRWRTRKVDSRTCRMANRAEIDQWIEDYGEDSDFVRVRVRGEFPRASSAQLISTETVEAAKERVLDERIAARYPLYLGVDVARYGTDRSVLTMRRGPVVYKPEPHREWSTMQVAGRAYELYMEHRVDVIFVDGIGVGAGVVDRLKELGAPVVDVQSAATAEDPRRYFNTRAEIWGRLAEWLEDAVLPDDEALADELTAVEYGFDSKMRLQIESKDDMIRRGLASPDVADSLAMTHAAPDRAARMLAGRGGRAQPVKTVEAVW